MEVEGGGTAEVRGLPLAGREPPPPIDQTVNDEPQPQVPVALGLMNLNPAPAMPST